MLEIQYGSEVRNGVKFGYGTWFSEPIPMGTLANQITDARLLGWSHGCPLAMELTDPSNPDYGPLKIARRYAEVNGMFRHIINQAEFYNPSLIEQMLTPLQRSENEPVGKHEPESVPMSYLNQMAPMVKVEGYASPRVVLLMKRVNERQDIIRMSLLRSTNPQDLLVNLSALAVGFFADPLQVLQHTLSADVLSEENCLSAYTSLAEVLERMAPSLHRIYLGLSTKEKVEAGIAVI